MQGEKDPVNRLSTHKTFRVQHAYSKDIGKIAFAYLAPFGLQAQNKQKILALPTQTKQVLAALPRRNKLAARMLAALVLSVGRHKWLGTARDKNYFV